MKSPAETKLDQLVNNRIESQIKKKEENGIMSVQEKLKDVDRKKKAVNLYLPPQAINKLEEYCDKNGMTKSAVVHMLIVQNC